MTDEEHAKHACIATGGAFVEVDEHKLDKGQTYLLGCQQTLDALIKEYQQKADEARMAPDAPSPWIATTLDNVIGRMTTRRDNISVELTRSAVKSGAAKIHNAFGKVMQ